MPGVGGLELVDRLCAMSPDSAVIVVTAFGSLDTAVEAFRKGAVDYLLKPVVPDDLFGKLRRIQRMRKLENELRFLRRQVSTADAGAEIIGSSPAMQKVKTLIGKVASAPSPVLILGETGTGKELVARSIHRIRHGEDAPLVAINCAALPRELIESELFGHVKGAFTGATADKPGLFEVASGGTLFLDEISEMPLDLQPKLLRAIEERAISRIGATKVVETPVRILAATNRDLKSEVDKGTFRQDLYFRIRVVEIRLPPLEERRDDIPLLVEHLVAKLRVRLQRKVRGVDADAMRLLMAADWPGNVRELENTLERAMLLAEGDILTVEDLPSEMSAAPAFAPQSDDLRAGVRAYEAHHIMRVLAETGGRREEAARRMGIDPSTLYRRLKDLDIATDPSESA
ncbi:MAG: sigma 54-interacting transcriptional regulator, partial [Thermoanaerobaculia bacterium]